MYEQFIRDRINELRMKKNISEYQLSLDLGHCQGYIQSITSGRNLPSMSAFLEMYTYFDITPTEFFDPTNKNPSLLRSIMTDVRKLSDNDLLLFSTILKRFIELYPTDQSTDQ